MGTNLARANWHAQRTTAPKSRRFWSKAEIAELESLLGKLTMDELMAHFGRNRSEMSTRLRTMGYRVRRNVTERLGLVAQGVSLRLQVPYERVYRDIQSGFLPAQKMNKRDFLVRWSDIRRYARHIQKLQRRREAVLKRIQEPTLTKAEYMRLLNLGETHATRYLQGGIVKAWKIPCKWQATPRQRWEWVVSRASAQRVKRLRESGRLTLRQRSYRTRILAEQAKITQRRQDLRAGKRQAAPRRSILPNHSTVAQVAQRVSLSETVVYKHIESGRLEGVRIKVGRVEFINVPNLALPAYERWCQRERKATGPKFAWGRAHQAIHAAGRLTLREAAQKFGLRQTVLMGACATGRLKYRRIGGLRAVTERAVRAFKSKYS